VAEPSQPLSPDATIPTKPRPATHPHHQRPKAPPHSSPRETLYTGCRGPAGVGFGREFREEERSVGGIGAPGGADFDREVSPFVDLEPVHSRDPRIMGGERAGWQVVGFGHRVLAFVEFEFCCAVVAFGGVVGVAEGALNSQLDGDWLGAMSAIGLRPCPRRGEYRRRPTRDREIMNMEGFLRPEATVLPEGALVPERNLIRPGPEPVHPHSDRSQPYFYDNPQSGTPPEGQFPAGTKVVLLVGEPS
jgi:hypothetical protein